MKISAADRDRQMTMQSRDAIAKNEYDRWSYARLLSYCLARFAG